VAATTAIIEKDGRYKYQVYSVPTCNMKKANKNGWFSSVNSFKETAGCPQAGT